MCELIYMYNKNNYNIYIGRVIKFKSRKKIITEKKKLKNMNKKQ